MRKANPITMMLKFIMLIVLFLLSACTEQENITVHQPHIYKGKQDLLKTQPQTLATRFKQVQTDR
jgi:uncharacterized lipoprotein YajG